MAQPRIELIDALRRTAKKLQNGAPYQWGHMGSCNCGNLAQEITQLTKAEIHAHALEVGRGDWNEQLNDYCSTSGFHMDLLISQMLQAGFTSTDLKNLEKLSDKKVLARLPWEQRNQLRHNFRDDVVLYFNEWANMLEDELLASIQLPDMQPASTLEEVLL